MPELHWLPFNNRWDNSVNALSKNAAWDDLRLLANHRIDFLQTAQVDRLLERHHPAPPANLPTKPVRLAVYASYTDNYLLPGIRVGGLRRNFWIRTYSPAY